MFLAIAVVVSGILCLLGAFAAAYYFALENPDFGDRIFRTPRMRAAIRSSRDRYRTKKAGLRLSNTLNRILTEAEFHKRQHSSPDTCRTRLAFNLEEYRAALVLAGITGSEVEQLVATLTEMWRAIINRDDDGNDGGNLHPPIPVKA